MVYSYVVNIVWYFQFSHAMASWLFPLRVHLGDRRVLLRSGVLSKQLHTSAHTPLRTLCSLQSHNFLLRFHLLAAAEPRRNK